MASEQSFDRLIAGLVDRGLVTRLQLDLAGVTPAAIKTRVARGTLHRLFRGVYTVGHPQLLPFALELGAVKACGQRALISHRSAAAAWSLTETAPKVVDVTVVGRRCRAQPGIKLHQVQRLDPEDVTARWGFPVVAPARTLLDLACQASDGELERALAQAWALRLVTDAQLEAALDRAPRNLRGVGRFKELLARQTWPGFTRSDAERRLLALIRAAALPDPHANPRVHGFEVDFLWPAARLVVEVDGHAFHGDRGAFERDRKRDQALVAAGLRVIRVTWRQISGEPFAVIARIAQALRPSDGTPAR